MSDLNDDLFSDLEPIEVPKSPTPQGRTIPSLSDSLHELGLFQVDEEPEQEVEPVLSVVEQEPMAVPEPTIEIAPVVEPFEPEVEPEADQPHHEEAEEPAVELDVEPDVAPESPAQVEQDLEPASQLPAIPIEQPKDESPDANQGSRFSRRSVLIIGGAVAACAIGGWFLFGSTNKESPIQPPVPVAIKPAPATVVEPEPAIEPTPIAVEPVPAPPVVEPVAPVVASVKPATATEAKPEVAATPKSAAPKPQRKQEQKPDAKPKAEPQWQDDALDALDDFEKRL